MLRVVAILLGLCSVTGWAAGGRPSATSGGRPIEWSFNILPRSLQRNPTVDIWIVTEHTPRGLELSAPSPSAPRYFVSVPGGYHATGDQVREKPPASDVLDRVLHSVLQSQGFEAADDRHPASLLLVCSWGSHHREMVSGMPILRDEAQPWRNHDRNPVIYSDRYDSMRSISDYEVLARIGPPPSTYSMYPTSVASLVQWTPDRPAALRKEDLVERAALLVGDTFARGIRDALADFPEDTSVIGPARTELDWWARQHPRGEFLRRTLDQSLYFVAVTAYDVAGVARGRRDVLWRTKIAITADGVSLRETTPAMLIAAGPHLGRPTDHAVLLQRRIDRRGKILFGEAEVVGWESGGDSAAKQSGARR